MAPPKTFKPTAGRSDSPAQRGFACAFGGLLGLSLVKFGNPAIMDEKVAAPVDVFEWVLMAWPLAVGQALFLLVAVAGCFAVRRRPDLPRWLVFAPLPWLGWQFIAATGSIESGLTVITLKHFLTNTAAFYLGLFCLSPVKELKWFWTGLITGFVLVLLSGWQQHFGGLAATREYFFQEIYPRMQGEVPEALMRRMSSDRVFATMFYANTLAGAILMLTPVCIGVFRQLFRPGPVRRVSLMLLLLLASACLVWTGSKAGWLLGIVLALVSLFRLRFSRSLKLGLAVVVVAGGTGGFLWRYSAYLHGGAQSAAARVDYWESALKVTSTHPVRGTGPGTFGNAYAAIKRPESEMARLTHNDYLQQASDSGLPGFVLFSAFIAGAMIWVGRRAWSSGCALLFWVWLGLVGITLQSCVEFGWYIPAISWPYMTLLGWLIGLARNDLDRLNRQNLTSRPYEGPGSQRPELEPLGKT